MARDGISRQVCQAVVEEINGNNFAIGFSAKRSRGDFSLKLSAEQGKSLRCDVVPVTFDSVIRHNRDCLAWSVPVHVVFRQVLAQGDRDEEGAARNEIIDPIEAVVEQVFAHFFTLFLAGGDAFTTMPAASLLHEPEWLTLYGQFDGAGEGGTLRNLGQFTSAFELMFEVSEDL